MKPWFTIGVIGKWIRASELEQEIRAFEEWTESGDHVDPRTLEKLTRALQDAR